MATEPSLTPTSSITIVEQSPGVGIFSDYFASKLETLSINQDPKDENKFVIARDDGTTLLRSELSGSRTVSDADGNQLFTIEQATKFMRGTLIVKDPSGKTIMELKDDFSYFNDKFKGTVTFTSKNGKEEVLMIKGDSDWAMITNQARDSVVAQIQLKAESFRTGRQRLTLQVMPGVDMALMVALTFEFITRVVDE